MIEHMLDLRKCTAGYVLTLLLARLEHLLIEHVTLEADLPIQILVDSPISFSARIRTCKMRQRTVRCNNSLVFHRMAFLISRVVEFLIVDWPANGTHCAINKPPDTFNTAYSVYIISISGYRLIA